MKEEPQVILPEDRYDAELLKNVRPAGWENPTPAPVYNLVVLGAGIAGLVAARGAAELGAKVALVEKRFIGGDCLNLGCVPSKTIISSSRVSEEVREAAGHGVRVICGSEADFPAVMERMRRLRARISEKDSVRSFKESGVDVFLGEGRFTGPDTLSVAGATLRFKKALIATGARPFHPPIEGLAEAGYLTSETVFNLTARPARMAILGGGAIGCEMAQAFQRLGVQTTILHNKPRLMDREDRDASAIIERVFNREGVQVVLGNWLLKKVETGGGEKALHLEDGGNKRHIPVDSLLVSVGRVPNVDGLGLAEAGVRYDPRAGVQVDGYLRTTNPRIYAAGDICLRLKFSHTAEAAAKVVLQNALLLGRRRFDDLVIPWTTFTDPEVAHVGAYAEGAEQRGVQVETFKEGFENVDRAILEGEEEGFAKIHVRKGTDEITGATIVARKAGEMINEITMAMQYKIGLAKLADVVHPYPTEAEAIKRCADKAVRARLTPKTRGAIKKWLKTG